MWWPWGSIFSRSAPISTLPAMKRNGIDRQPHFFVLRMNHECRESVL
jgi:hypothetical protein